MSERPIARVPTVLQMEAVECGAACLAMILGYHGRHVSLEEVRDECGVSRDGAKAGSVVKAARRYGLEAHGFRREPGGLGDLPLPYVVFWAMNHFVVIEGFRDGKVWLNDPAVGPRRISEDEFDRYFTGVVLTFVPGPDFVRGGHPPRLWDGLRRRLVGSTAGLWLVVLVTLSLVVPGVVIPGILRVFVDDYLVGGFDDWLRPMLFGLFLAATTKTLLDYLQQRYLLRLQVKLALTSSSKFVWHLLGLPMEFFSQRFAGDLSRRIEANDRVAHLLSGEVSTSMVNLVSASFYALVMLSYNLVLGAIAIGLQLLNLLAVRLVWRRREDVNRYLLQLQGKLLAVSMNGVLTIETVKATGAEPELFERWAGYQSKLVSTEQELGVFTQLAQVAPTLLSGLTIAAVLGYGSLAVMDGELTVGGLVAFQSVMLLFATPIRGFVQFGDRLQEAGGDLARLDDVLHYEARPLREASAGEGTAPRKLSGHVDIANLSFGYSKVGEPVIEGFDLHLQPGARVAIVGPTGSGKSTLLKLVAGLFQPWQGQVLLDGRPVAEINRRVLANSLAAVDQEIFLFEGTVRDNLTLWDDTVPQERIEAAARDACIHDVIMARPQGYGGFVAEGGANFSGGERQRLEIARGLAIEPSVLVLDEATSALDPVTELQIDDNLRRRGCTCLIVAHRLSTVRDCEEIIVLDEGRIVERGTHDALMAKQGKYAALVRSQ